MMMLVIPILIFPIIMNLFASVSKSFQEEAANKKIKIGIVGTENNFLQLELNAIPKELGEKEIILYKDTLSLINDLKKDSLQLGAYVSSEFNQLMDSMHPAPLTFFFNATDMGMKERAEAYMAVIDAKAKSKRFVKLGIEEARTQPITTEYRNIASDKEMIGKLAGGILPYIFIAFGFIGCMYPAIDLFTGEKERGTIETLLTTPVARWQILFGKMGVVVLSGLTAATCALLGLFFSIEFIDSEGNAEILKIVHSILNPTFIVLLYSLLIPLTVFFAGLMIPIAVNAKSFKEAQSIITPLNIVMVLPAMVGFFPGIELNFVTACIPVVNIVLATKELIAGSLDIGLVALSFSVMMSLAILSVIFSYKRFDNETNIIN
jgi:sodium transport system permease protein